MADNDDASRTGEQTGNEAGTDGQGSKGDSEFVPPKDGSWVPRDAMNERVAKRDAKIARLEADLAALHAKAVAADAPKRWTREELGKAVAEGKMSQVAAAEAWEAQRDAEVEAKVLAKVEGQSQATRKQETVAVYQKAIPALSDPDSAESLKLAEEHRHMVNDLGLPNSPATVLAALRAAFGPIESLRVLQRKEPDTFSETGGSGSSPLIEVGKGLKLTAREKAFYEKGINAGLYKDWDEVRAERKDYKPGRLTQGQGH